MADFAIPIFFVKIRFRQDAFTAKAPTHCDFVFGSSDEVAIGAWVTRGDDFDFDEFGICWEFKSVAKEAKPVKIRKTHRAATGCVILVGGYVGPTFLFCVNGGTLECEIWASLILSCPF